MAQSALYCDHNLLLSPILWATSAEFLVFYLMAGMLIFNTGMFGVFKIYLNLYWHATDT